MHLSVERHGNTGAASIALALDEASRSGRLNVDDRVLLVGFGGGMSLGLALLTWAAGPELVASASCGWSCPGLVDTGLLRLMLPVVVAG